MILYLFTATFPYGKAECFLEDEIKSLCSEFEQVVVIPLSARKETTRDVPDNCQVLSPVIMSKRQQYIRGLFCIRTLRIFISDFFVKKVYLSTTRLKEWFVAMVLTNNLVKSKGIKSIFKKIQREDICYFYWGKGSNLLSCIYKGRAKFVSRFHGEWDLWEESSGNYAPCRNVLAQTLDKAVFISKKGEAYFHLKYPQCKTTINPLGSIDYGECVVKKYGDTIKVVSCSTIYPLKRVPLIFETLNEMSSLKIEWTHIGGGKDFTFLKQKIEKEKKNHLSVKLLGSQSHDKVMLHYKYNYFDVFINLSTNEGVPVSIMEAESFNIPVVATDVGGTSEVVTEQAGVLVSPNPDKAEVAEAINKVLKSHYTPRDYWQSKYNAAVNYTSFAKMLKSL